MPSSPGPGYTWDDPLVRGWRDPGRFIENWTAYFDPAVLWHVDLRTERGLLAPPLPLSDESLLVIDGGRLVRITPDGRLLWRINLDRPAVAITLHENVPLLTYADGTMQRVNIDGTLGERWATGIALSGPAFAAGDALIFPAADGALTAFDAARQSVLWRLDGVGVPRQSHFTGQLIGLTTTDARLLTLSAGGAPLDTATLRGTGSLADNGDGTLLAYTYGGLWSILSDGVWQLALADAPASDDSRAALRGPDEALYLFDGAALSAYTRDGTLRWQGTLPPVSGAVTLAHYDDALLLTSTGGHILAIDPASGGLCGTLKVHGDDAAALWRDLGADGVLRIAVSDQILGLDWARLRGGCAA
jgi:outer membrane protein assembly factor BamB